MQTILVRFLLLFFFINDGQNLPETLLTGVYQGKPLFIQNPFIPESGSFCIETILVNGKTVPINYNFSAIKIDFIGIDLYTPVSVRILQRDSTCRPIIINPDAINFHSMFSFRGLALNDSVITWQTVGDKSGAKYIIEKYESGIWIEADVIPSEGRYEGAVYSYFPELNEGANKYRVKYIYPNETYLYSNELDFHYYPEPVTFTPKVTSKLLEFSRSATYDIYDGGGELVMSGRGIEVDVSSLPKGDYVIYFDGENPTLFTRQ